MAQREIQVGDYVIWRNDSRWSGVVVRTQSNEDALDDGYTLGVWYSCRPEHTFTTKLCIWNRAADLILIQRRPKKVTT